MIRGGGLFSTAGLPMSTASYHYDYYMIILIILIFMIIVVIIMHVMLRRYVGVDDDSVSLCRTSCPICIYTDTILSAASHANEYVWLRRVKTTTSSKKLNSLVFETTVY
jgi:hypothetical protein